MSYGITQLSHTLQVLVSLEIISSLFSASVGKSVEKVDGLVMCLDFYTGRQELASHHQFIGSTNFKNIVMGHKNVSVQNV